MKIMKWAFELQIHCDVLTHKPQVTQSCIPRRRLAAMLWLAKLKCVYYSLALSNTVYFPWWLIKWKHFLRYWPFVQGIHWSLVNSPHKGQWRGPLMFSLICAWINDWVNNHETGYLRLHRAHYDVIGMHRDYFIGNWFSDSEGTPKNTSKQVAWTHQELDMQA